MVLWCVVWMVLIKLIWSSWCCTETSGRAGCDPSRKRCEVGSGTTRESHQCHIQELRETGEIGRDIEDWGVAWLHTMVHVVNQKPLTTKSTLHNICVYSITCPHDWYFLNHLCQTVMSHCSLQNPTRYVQSLDQIFDYTTGLQQWWGHVDL